MKITSPPVIYYHSVAPKQFDKWVLGFLTMPLNYFENQLALLDSKNYRGIFLDEWLHIRKGTKTSTGNEVCFTFDDGLLDNWVYAFPLAMKYGIPFTLFVSPEHIDPRDIVRPTLADVWNGKCSKEALEDLGYASWKELKIMQESGFVDIQSHTMSHSKYIASPKIDEFYYGGYKGLHYILNADPKIKPFYMTLPEFEKRLQWGTPLFEETSAVTARKHKINPDFFKEIAALTNDYKLGSNTHRPFFEDAANKIYDHYKSTDKLIKDIESDEQYRARLTYEIVDSKDIIEEKLKKPVQFLCWPHGDNTSEAHTMAKGAGYLATTSGKMTDQEHEPDRIPRYGTIAVPGKPWLSRQKFHYKIASHFKKQPYYSLALLNGIKNRILNN